jgi:hypothetical protein
MVFVRPLLKRRLYASIDAEAGAPPQFLKKKKKKIDYLLKIFLDYQLPFFAQERELFI